MWFSNLMNKTFENYLEKKEWIANMSKAAVNVGNKFELEIFYADIG